MLNDRERQCLAAIEAQLLHSDPRLVARFRRLGTATRRDRPRSADRSAHRSMHAAGTFPCLMLAAAMVLLLVGATTGAMPLVAAGAVVALLMLGVAATSAARPGPGFA